MGETAKTWQGLLQKVLEANGDIVSSKRLKGHLDTFAEKSPSLKEVRITDGKVELREGFPEDESGLVTVATVIGVLYWTMVDMHTEPAAAAERIRRPIREYKDENLPPGTVLGLNKHLPALDLEGSVGEAAAGPGRTDGSAAALEEAQKAAADAARAAEDGRRRELWERSAGEATADGSTAAAGGSEAAAAGLEGEALAAQYHGTVPWLGEDIPRGCSLLVEGAGEAKETAALRFVGDGLRGGESVLALIAYPPEEFRRRLAALGYETKNAEEAGRLKILDWATFRERHVGDLEDEGPVMRLPMELTSVNPAVNMGLAELPETESPRAFCNILPRALATVAIETVFNFVQVTILKFKRRKMTGLFIMEEEKDPEKAAIRLSFNSWLEVGDSPDGKYTVRLGGPILRSKLKTVSYADGGWSVEKEESLAPEPAPTAEAGLSGELRARASEWRSQGYDVSTLEEALRGEPKAAGRAFERFGADVARLRTIRNDLRILDLAGYESEAAAIQEMLQDVGRVEQAERAHAQLRQKLDRKQAAAREKGGGAAPAPAAARPGEAAAPAGPDAGAEGRRRDQLRRDEEAVRSAQDQARQKEEAERRARDAAGEEKRREYREDVARWKREGYAVDQLEPKIELDMESARKAVVLFRVQIRTLQELGESLAAIEAPPLQKRKAELAAMLKDVDKIPDLAKGLERLRAESARIKEDDRARRDGERRRRAELAEKMFWWSSHGLSVEGLERVLDGDLGQAEREFSAYEGRAQRLISLKERLAAMDTTGVPEAAARLEATLNDVEQVERAETEFAALKELVERRSREALERKTLADRLEGWRAKGFRTEAVQKALEGDLEPARSALARFEESARAAEALSAQLASMDLKGSEARAAQLRELLADTSRLDEARGLLAAIRADQERARAEALERGEYRRRTEEWKKSGLPTGRLEGLLDSDIQSLRKAVMAFQFDVDLHDDLLGQLEPLARSRHAEEAARLQGELKDFSRLPELEERVAALRAAVETEAVAAGKELGREFETDVALMEKVQGWIAGGMAVRRLEGALRHDRDPWRAEMERLEKEIEELSREASALEVLDTKGHETEIEHVRSMLNDPDNLPLVKVYRDTLRSRIARRKKEGERKAELAAVARDWERKGLRVRHLTEALKGDIEGASAQFVLLRARMSAAEHLRRRLDALELFGKEAEVERLRRRLYEAEEPSEIRPEIDRLWSAAEEGGRERAARRKAARERKRALRERIMGWLEKGMSIRRLERALELPPEEAEKELVRFEEDVRKLGALGERLSSLGAPALEPELAALRSMLDDVDAIPDIERGLSALAEKAERARREEESRLEAERARQEEVLRKAALRRKLEERLREWSGLGLKVDSLRTALATDLPLAEKRFSEFEGALGRCEELRSRLHALQARGVEGVAGADAIERMLQDPLNLPQAEQAFAEFSQRAEAALAAAEAEMEQFRHRIRELDSRGEDVSALERAWKKGLKETRQAFAGFERELVKRERMETWRGIKSKLLGEAAPAGAFGGGAGTGPEPGAPGAGAEAGGQAGAPADRLPEGTGAAPPGAARKKVRKVKK